MPEHPPTVHLSPTAERSAVAFNAKQARRLGWHNAIPAGAIAAHPGLSNGAIGRWGDKVTFTRAVVALQRELSLDEDGKLGRGTWSALLTAFDFVGPLEAYAVSRGRRIPPAVQAHRSLDSNNFDAGGLDLHPGGRFYSWHNRDNKHKRIALHWGGHDCRSCYNALSNRGVSSHYGVDTESVEQWLDLAHTGMHAGYANADSIGIDVCQQPTVGFAGKYKSRGYDVREVDNPAIDPRGRVRGNKRVLTLDSRVADNLRDLLRFLCGITGVPYSVPRGHDGKQTSGELWHGVFTREELYAYEGIFCHSNVAGGKWDISPWMGQLFGQAI